MYTFIGLALTQLISFIKFMFMRKDNIAELKRVTNSVGAKGKTYSGVFTEIASPFNIGPPVTLLIDDNSGVSNRHHIFRLANYEMTKEMMKQLKSLPILLKLTSVIYTDQRDGTVIFYTSYEGKRIVPSTAETSLLDDSAI